MRHHAPYSLVKRGKVWHVRYYLNGKRVTKSTAETLKPRAEEVARKLAEGTAPLFSEYAAGFYDWDGKYLTRRREVGKRTMSEGSAAAKAGILRKWLMPRWGDCHLNEIELASFEDWLHELPLGPQSKNHIMYSMGLILREAVRRRELARNPLEGIESYDLSAARKRDILTAEELAKLFPADMNRFLEIWPTRRWRDSLPINYGVAFALAVSGGLRSGELRALRWKHVVWGKGIVVEAAVKYGNKEGTPKWGKVRAVWLPQRTMDLLSWWRDQTQPQDLEEHVFPMRDRRSLAFALRAGFKRSGISTEGRFLDVHALRHTYVSQMRNLIDDDRLRAFTGHGSEKMTEHYDHAQLTDRLARLEDQRQNVDRFWGGVK